LETYFPEYFDKILIDAPCSGEGMFRKDKKMVKAWEEHGPEFFAKIQRSIVTQAARMLKPGGMMLYSTCTFDPEENEGTIEYLLEQYPDNQYIISNRPGETAEFKGVPVFLLMKLSDEQIRTFLEKNTQSQDTIDIINEAIAENARLKSIVRTPLMFSRLIDIVEVTGKVPTSEGQIIGAFLDTLFVREKNEKMDALFDVRKATYLLRTIAYQGLEDASTNAGMTEETVLSYMKYCMQSYCFQVDAFYMLDLFVQLGILIRRDDLYVFAHQAYQDYYHAAEEMALLGL
jgi:hypothetical protein